MPLENRDRQSLIDLLGKLPARCYATFLNVKIQTSDDRIWLGDLFVTSGGIVIFPYANPRPSPLDPTSFLTASSTANIVANECRAWLIGASIEERIRYHKGEVEPFVIPTSKIVNLLVKADGVLIQASSQVQKVFVVMQNALEFKAAIDELLHGSPKQKSDSEFVNLGLPPLGLLFEEFASGHIGKLVTPAVLDEMSRHEEYIQRFVSLLSRSTPSTRKSISSTIMRTPGRFSEIFREIQKLNSWYKEAIKSCKKGFAVGFILAIGFIAIFGLWALCQDDPVFQNRLASGLGLLITLVLVLSLVGAMTGFCCHPLPPRFGSGARAICVIAPASVCIIASVIVHASVLGAIFAFFAGLFPAISQFGGGDDLRITTPKK